MTTDKTDSQHSEMPATSPGQPSPRPRAIRSAIVLSVLGVLSFSIGFLLVHFALPSQIQPAATSSESAASPIPEAAAPMETSNSDAEGAMSDEEIADTPNADADAEASGGLPEVPPGPTPDGIRLDGVPLYFKCWADSSDASGSKDCDRLRVLEKRMATRLYVVQECKIQHAGESALGLLSLGANLDFADNTIRFWSGPSSTIAEGGKIGNCVRTKLAGLPLSSIEHRFQKYRLFFSVDFFDPKQREQLLARKRKNGREVKVLLDKVNVREEPVDGASLGRISSDSTVTFLKKNETGEWCNVLTPSNREGWMICSALKL